VQAEAGAVLVVGQRDLGEDLRTAPPRRPQALERGPVLVSGGGDPLVQLREVERLRAGGRPRAECGPFGAPGGEDAGAVLVPGSVRE
jgi:hypothetical protein